MITLISSMIMDSDLLIFYFERKLIKTANLFAINFAFLEKSNPETSCTMSRGSYRWIVYWLRQFCTLRWLLCVGKRSTSRLTHYEHRHDQVPSKASVLWLDPNSTIRHAAVLYVSGTNEISMYGGWIALDAFAYRMDHFCMSITYGSSPPTRI